MNINEIANKYIDGDLNEGVKKELEGLDAKEYAKLREGFFNASDGITSISEILGLPKSEKKIWDQIAKLADKSDLGKYL